MKLQPGTYVRESGGANLCYHSPTTWVDPVFAVNQLHYYTSKPAFWRIVPQEEVQELGRAGWQLWPGEFVIVEEEKTS